MKKLLVVVDYQNDFVDGALGFAQAREIEDAICEKIEKYQEEGEVVYTLDTHTEEYEHTQEGRKLPVRHCLKGTHGHKVYGKAAKLLEGCRAFEKGIFGSDKFFDYLRAHPYDMIELVGVVSNICIISNAILARTACPEAEIVVDHSCTASNDSDMNQKALEVMQGLQITVL
jgi:nicotinamidase/pyrazinamidase